ncbi:hypothetical protein CFC21_044831 [Triticum aestivum]|uniref:rRNA N-glycosidase n=2 Tax=Triticum aestivum TaxID=4565 RepID=A0A9R1JY36_WHEAT|nr:hypothetical protein CFC21_044831 [Triticum aestivum]CDM87004.1 unnamed protein product [Triticum aestivum]
MAAFHLLFVLVLALAASSSASVVAAADDDDVRLRQEVMMQALGVKQALAVLNREVEARPQQWKPIFKALDKVMDSGADDRSRAEASTELKVLLDRELGPCPDSLRRDLGIGDL